MTDPSRLCSRVHRGCSREGGGSFRDIDHVGHYCSPMESFYGWSFQLKRSRNRDRVGHPENLIIEKSLRLGFLATNNEAEYEALPTRVAMVRQLGGEMVELYSNSRLVVGQVNGEFEARDERMRGYLAIVQNVLSKLNLRVLY